MFSRLFEKFGWGLFAVLVVQIATSLEAVAVMHTIDNYVVSMFRNIQESIEEATGLGPTNTDE